MFGCMFVVFDVILGPAGYVFVCFMVYGFRMLSPHVFVVYVFGCCFRFFARGPAFRACVSPCFGCVFGPVVGIIHRILRL